mgnify:CR=1 FL=1
MPDYGIDPTGLAQAIALYSRLLPTWNIRPIYCGDLIVAEGALQRVQLAGTHADVKSTLGISQHIFAGCG